MAQVHFIEVRRADGEWVMVRSDSIDAIEPRAGGLTIHTPSGAFFAAGATRATLHDDMRSAQIVLVPLNKSTGAVAAQPEAPTPSPQPAKTPVVRAPPPVIVPGVNAPEPDAPEAQIMSATETASTASKTRRKTVP